MSPVQLPVSRRSQDLFYDDQKLIDDALVDIENQKFGEYYENAANKKASRKRKVLLLIGLLSSYAILYLLSAPLQKILPEEISNFPKAVYSNMFIDNTNVEKKLPIEQSTTVTDDTTLNVTEVFEVLPVLTPPLGSFEYSDILIEEQELTKGAVFNYTAPETFNFTDVLLTLNFSILGPQTPLIFDIYLDDYPIWRTSTPNPLDSTNLTISSTTKNLTDYLSLFKSDKDITLNLVDGDFTGTVNVSLSAVFYNETLSTSLSTAPASSVKFSATDLFVATKPADVVYPISKDGSSFQLPKENLKIKLPKLSKNITIARLELFASASEEEVNYYKNAIGKSAAVKAVGPLRAINVFIDSIFVAAISPNPSLLRSDKLGASIDSAESWIPVVSTGTFDALSYELDLTSVLPLLWKGEVTLEVEVVSLVKSSTMVIPFVGGPVPKPGSDIGIDVGRWDVTGNLLAWESELVSNAKGEILTADSLINGTGILIGPPGGFYESQIVRGDIESGLITVLNYTLFDNSTISIKSTVNSTCGAISLNQKTNGIAPTEGLTLISSSKFNFAIENNTLPLPAIEFEFDAEAKKDKFNSTALYTYNKTTAFPLVIKEKLATKPIWGPAKEGSIEYKVGYGFQTKINGTIYETFNSRQNSTIDDLGVSTDSSTLIQLADAPLPFSRDVSVVDGVIIKDSLVLEDFISEYLDFSYIVNFDEVLDVTDIESSEENHELLAQFFD